jgi:hypothetical protein
MKGWMKGYVHTHGLFAHRRIKFFPPLRSHLARHAPKDVHLGHVHYRRRGRRERRRARQHRWRLGQHRAPLACRRRPLLLGHHGRHAPLLRVTLWQDLICAARAALPKGFAARRCGGLAYAAALCDARLCHGLCLALERARRRRSREGEPPDWPRLRGVLFACVPRG